MDNYQEIEKAFELCRGQLGHLPSKYKKWRNSLQLYRAEWNFLYDGKLRDDIAQRCMTCDYLFSLSLWLKPYAILEQDHRFVIILLLASIYEGILRDILLKEKNKSQFIDKLITEKRSRFSDLIEAARESEFIDDQWQLYLKSMNDARNDIHLSSNSRDNSSELAQRNLQDLLKDLNSFKEFIRGKYKEKEIPF
jgi:vacuolar-type H+-ATPase subunit H